MLAVVYTQTLTNHIFYYLIYFFIVILIIYKKFSDFQNTLIFIWVFGFTYFTRTLRLQGSYFPIGSIFYTF